MEKSKKMSVKKLIVIILAAVLLLAIAALAVWLIAFQDTKIVPAKDPYSYRNPAEVKAEPDEGFIIDGILDEAQYQNCNWLKLKNTQGGAGAELAMTSFYGENGMYIVYDITENAMIYVNPDRPSYLNSCIEMYLASSNASSMNSNEIFEIDMLPTGDLSVRQRTGKDNWVNAASTDDIMAHLGATTKGGPVNTEQCTGYYLELFIPWAYLDKVGIDAAAMQESFFYINPVHITSFNYEGTNASSDRYWYGFATQLGSDGWNDVSQFFRFGAKGVLGTVPVELKPGANYTISGNDSVIPGMMTVVEIKPDAGYALSSIIINGEEHIDRVSYNKDGSVTLQLRGEKEGLTISAAATEVTQGNKTLSGSVQMHKLGGDTLDGVEVSYKGPQGEKPITIDSDGNFQLTGLEQGYYIVTAIKQGYTPINRGIYLNRDMETVFVLEYEMFQPESGYNWILDDQNDGVLNRFGGSGKILSVDSYDKFAVEAAFRYDTELAKMSAGDTYLQQRTGIQIKFSNGKYWRIDLMRENGVFKVQYAKHNDATVFGWKTVHELTESEIAQYQSEEGIKLSVLRDGKYAWVCLDGKPVAIEVLDSEYAHCTAQIGFEGWIANKEIAQMQYNISADVNKNLKNFYVGTSEKWNISEQFDGVLSLPGGGTNFLKFHYPYNDFDFALENVRENDPTGSKPGRTDILLEFDLNGDGKPDKSISFGITCTDRANKICWLQTLGNADNYISATRIKGLYKLSAKEAEKYLYGYGVELRVIRKGTDVYVFLDGEEVAIWDLTQNNSGVTAKTPASLSVRHYDAPGAVTLNFEISDHVGEVKIDRIFKENEKWDISNQYQGIVILPGGGTDTSLQFFKKYQNIDLTLTAKEHYTTEGAFGRTDVLFEFDLNNDGTMDKNVSFGIIQLSGGRCVLQTLGWSDKHIPANRINELYELTYAQTLKYKGEGIDFRVVRYETMVYLYLDDVQVAVFDLTQNDSGVKADSKATMFLRHYDAIADEVVIPFKVTDQVEKPELQEQPKPVFKPNYKWDLSDQYEGVVSLPGGGTNALAFYDQFTDIDLTITAKENKAATAANGGRTDILFEFENGKNVSFGIVKWSATSSCIVETLGNSTNHIPVNRKNTLYKLSDAETNAYLTDGVQLRVVRVGTDVHVILENQIVAVFDLTQNGSGVTADMPATVSLRHYDAVTDQVVIPFTVTEDITQVTITDNSTDGVVGAKNEVNFVGAEIILVSKTTGRTLIGLKLDGAEVPLNSDGTYSFIATKTEYTVEGIFASAIFEGNYDDTLWDISGQYEGVVTVIGGGGSTAQPLQFAGTYRNIDLTINARDYADSSTAARTDVEFMFDVNGDGLIDTAKGDQSVTFGVVYSDGSYRVQTRGGTLLNWKTPYDLNQAEIDQFVITAAEVASGSEDGLDFRMIRYGTVMYLFIENKQVAFCDLTKCANSAGDKASNVTAETEMFVYLRHYDDKRSGGVDIPFAISTEVTPVTVSLAVSGQGTVTANPVNYYVNNGRTSKYSDTHFMGERITLTAKEAEGNALLSFLVDGVEQQLGEDGIYYFVASKDSYEIEATFGGKQIFETNYDTSLWDISGQNEGFVTVIGGGGSTAQPLQFAGVYQNVDLTINARDYADSSSLSRTDVEFAFDVNGDGVIDTAKGDQTVTFGIAEGNRVQTRGGTILSWKTPYDLSQTEKDQLVITAAEVAAGNEDGLDLRIIRYGTTVYLFVEGKQVAFCDLTKCANSAGDTESGVTADTKMFIYLRHYDDKRGNGVKIPFAISTEVTPVTLSVSTNGKGTVTANMVNYYINNGRTSKVSDTHFMDEEVILTVKPETGSQITGFTVNGVETALDGDGAYSFITSKTAYDIKATFGERKIFETNYDSTLWDISGQNEGYVTVIGGGGSTAQALQFAGAYQNIDLTINARDYADSSTAARTDVEFTFDVDGDGVINTSKGDQTVTFGVVYSDNAYRVQTRGGTLLNWKTPHDLTQAEIDKFVITAAEVASGNEDGLDLRMVRYGTVMYLFVEGRQVAFCDLTKCANSAGDKASNVKADTKMYVYLRHYDDKRAAGVEIPFSISTEVTPASIAVTTNGQGTVTANSVNYYVNNGRTSKASDTHFIGEKVVLTVKPETGKQITGFKVNGVEVQLEKNADGSAAYTFTVTKQSYSIEVTFA